MGLEGFIQFVEAHQNCEVRVKSTKNESLKDIIIHAPDLIALPIDTKFLRDVGFNYKNYRGLFTCFIPLVGIYKQGEINVDTYLIKVNGGGAAIHSLRLSFEFFRREYGVSPCLITAYYDSSGRISRKIVRPTKDAEPQSMSF